MKRFLFILIPFILFTSCKKEEIAEENLIAGSNQYINNWIYDNMEFYYYWTEDLPSKKLTDTDPEAYFYSLLSTKDRFSWIEPNFDELLNSLRGVNKEAGYEFILYNDPDNANNVIGQISYVKPNAPASKSNIIRGDIFKKINNITLTLDNYRELISEISETHSLQIERYDFEKQEIQLIGSLELTTEVVAENPILMDTVYTIGNYSVGYLVYNLFSVGSEQNSQEYLTEIDAVFGTFKSKNIDHLILDLRYNGGGAETATINLASLIGPNISENDIFIKRKYNPNFEAALKKEYGDEILNKFFVDKAQNIGSLLKNQQLIILTSSRTASASELLINGLKPYMNTYLIGDKTVGKNVGSTTIYDDEDPENTYGMQPIITQSFNSVNLSDYGNGFIPDVELIDNSLIKRQLGDLRELLLAEAISYITSNAKGVLGENKMKQHPLKSLISSQELKRNYGLYTIDLEKDDLP